MKEASGFRQPDFRLSLEIDLSAGHPGNVQEIVEQSFHVLDLALDDPPIPLDVGVLRSLPLEKTRGRPDGRERIPELMRQHRQELVLPPPRCMVPTTLVSPASDREGSMIHTTAPRPTRQWDSRNQSDAGR
jgi:hypothetical protein